MKNLSAVVLVSFVGCGGGWDDSTLLRDLSVEESQEVCSSIVDDYPARTITCSGQMITMGLTAADCDDAEPASESCEATVGYSRFCQQNTAGASEEQLCMMLGVGTLPEGCAEIAACY